MSLTPHTAATRAKLRNQGSLFRKINTQALTHFVDLRLPRDIGLILSVQGTLAGETVVVAEHVYAPVQGIRQVALAAFKLEKSYRLVAGSSYRTQLLGLDPADLTSWQEVADLDAIVDPEQTAVSLVFKHPNVATRDQVATPTTKALLQQTPEVTTLGKYIQTMTDNGVPYGKHVQAVNRDGTPAQLLIKGQLKTFTTIQLNSTDSTFTGNMTSAVVAGVHGVKNTGSLGTVVNQPLDALQDKKDTSTWHTPEGTLPTVTAYSASPAADSTVTATVANSGLLYGTYTTASPYANGQVPVKLYNNFVRWVTVYVQYLDAAGNNLSHVTTGPPPKWPDTTYAKSLGILPQIFTLLGVPIWDTNTLTATLDFPDNAVKANILFCGLGNGAAEGGWQQYFKGAYPADAIAPKNEVLVPALITGILSIGLTAFALCIDLDIATTWNALRKITEDNIEALEGLLVSLLADAPWATAAETFAMTVAAGAATYTDISANGGGQNVWSVICNALMSMLPKILMNPATNLFWVDVVALIFSDEALEKAIDLIPVAGMIFAAIAAAGDAVTLAEAIGESAASPWVIGNSISLTYPVTVTVGYDKQHASTWPETATSWKLMAAIDGTTVLAPVVGPLNVGGRTGNSPIVFPWTAPFGGDNITWSISILDAEGNLVGSGSVQLPNNGATPRRRQLRHHRAARDGQRQQRVHPPRHRRLRQHRGRLHLVQHGDRHLDEDHEHRDPGGHRGHRVDAARRHRGGVEGQRQVLAARHLGHRGRHDADDGRGVQAGVRPSPVRALRPVRRPGGRGEPRPPRAGRRARRLPRATAAGRRHDGFADVAVRHLDRVVPPGRRCRHLDRLRLGRDDPHQQRSRRAGPPEPDRRAPTGPYAAGPGNLTGLLTAPTALTVTNAGTVIILNAGASELAAFDLLGSPVRCFGTTAPLSFTLKLPQAAAPQNRTYLDVSVDGSGQIYVLSYTGTGSQVSGYRVDVYLPNGTPLVTGSTG